MLNFNIPAYKLRLDSALLECQYEMNGKPSNSYNRNHHVYEQHFGGGGNYDSNEQNDEGETLYSVKFYKDNEEFYRYMPKAKPPQHSYRVEGIKVDVSTYIFFFYLHGPIYFLFLRKKPVWTTHEQRKQLCFQLTFYE